MAVCLATSWFYIFNEKAALVQLQGLAKPLFPLPRSFQLPPVGVITVVFQTEFFDRTGIACIRKLLPKKKTPKKVIPGASDHFK